jgi:hypothetical protein
MLVDRYLLLSAMHKLYDDDMTPTLLNSASCDASPEVADAMLFFVREIQTNERHSNQRPRAEAQKRCRSLRLPKPQDG